MEPSAVTEPERRVAHTSKISHWSFDPHLGQINACDERGELVMAIPADPMFGRRLAAAFDTPPAAAWPAAQAPQSMPPQISTPRPLAQPSLYVAHQAWSEARVAA